MRNSIRHNCASTVDCFVKYVIDESRKYTDKNVQEVILSLIPEDQSRLETYRHNGYVNETWQIRSEERIRTIRLLKERGVIE